jgi:two-component system, cell cycle sensor histidine kinase and response regulator CckA
MEPITVLVVDDEEAVRGLLSRVLETGGYKVIAVGDAVSALAILRESRPEIQVVVSDIMMQGMDGISLYESASGEFGDLPFIFITGYAENERMISVPTRYPVITKPFVPEALLRCIRHVLKTA